jgi:leucyl-tRNA synthetase
MSKSKGNVVDPLEIVDSGYGADALRVYEMFIAPYDMEAPWDTRGVPGTYRFLQRTWNLTQAFIDSADASDTSSADDKQAILRIAHKTVKKVTGDIEVTKFNTSVSAMMEAVNSYLKLKESVGMSQSPAWRFAVESLLQLLAPFAPHITEELWHAVGHKDSIHINNWPKYDDKYLIEDTITIVVQVNGKVRAQLKVAADTAEDDIVDQAKADANIVAHLRDKEIVKTVFVPGKLVSFVVK